jgi:hypothetical protein
MMSMRIRSRTARCLGAAIGALALAAALPATASADRDGRGWRHDRRDDHGRRHEWRGRDHGRGYHHAFRRIPAVHRHGPSCGFRPSTRYDYRPYHPQVVFYRGGWFFGR